MRWLPKPRALHESWRLHEEGNVQVMPVHKVKGGYKWGKSGKVYKTKAAAERQGRAIYAAGYKKKK